MDVLDGNPAAAPPRPGPVSGCSEADSSPGTADEALVLRRAARSAEDGGNFLGARRLVQLLPADPEQVRWLRSLDEVIALGPAPEAGPLGLWLMQPALRSGLGSLRAGAVRLLVHEVLRARGAEPCRPLDELAHFVLDDPLLADAALFDAGLLAAYVGSGPAVLSRAAPLADWPSASVSVFELSDRGGHVLARDLLDDRQIELALPAATPRNAAPAPLVYGRPVPWPGEPGARFVLPPLALDRVTARRVLRAISRRAPVVERIRAVAAHQRRTGTAPTLGAEGF